MSDLSSPLLVASLAASLLATVAEIARRGNRLLAGAVLLPVTVVLISRATEIGFVPLTNKFESFLGFSTAVGLAVTARYHQLGRPGRVLLFSICAAFLAVALTFDSSIHYPSPLLYTTWYALHVPLSFGGYALWLAAAADGLDGVLGATGPAEAARRQDSNVRLGLALFSAAMVFGAIWGVVSWGVYFLWDAKIIWSLAIWLYFASVAHLRFWPVQRSWSRFSYGAVGLAAVLFTYVGTSFMKGSIHAF